MKIERKILHIDMDAFFASVEQAHNPRLKGKPLIVGGRPDKKRTVVCAASYEAKALGIDSGMSTQEALRICPHAEFVSADSSKYLYVSKQIGIMLKNYSPQVEQASVDEFYLDVTGLDKLFGSYLDIGMQIKRDIQKRFGITGSVGISVNRLMSKIASKLKKPDGMVIMEVADIPRMLAGLPVKKIPGIGPSLSQRLNDYSIFTFSDMRNIPESFFLEKFGKIGLWMYTTAYPELSQEENIHWFCEKGVSPKSVGHSYTLEHNIYIRRDIEAWLMLLCEMVGARLRRYGLESKILHVYLRKPDMGFIAREKNFNVSSNDSGDLFKRAVFILQQLSPRNTEIRALGVTARGLGPCVSGFLFAEQKKKTDLSQAQDRLNEKYGEWTVHPASILSIR